MDGEKNEMEEIARKEERDSRRVWSGKITEKLG